ncbi:hypothetical protein CPB85DRAFT_1336400 [Mucidula mucida]|nr:hypothetical protein CPB85DRAFT_1336400 [Mucidula mucida]
MSFKELATHPNNDASDSDSDTLESQNDNETPKVRDNNEINIDSNSGKVWFPRPKYMSRWLYSFFGQVVQPITHFKDKKVYLKHTIFTQNKAHTPPSLWIHPPEPLHSLLNYSFDPTVLYRPRVFLWLVHHLVDRLLCPGCGKPLEKNGALPPRRVVDSNALFYIVIWAYYCRKGCRKHFHGWNEQLIALLPTAVCLAFPAVCSGRVDYPTT